MINGGTTTLNFFPQVMESTNDQSYSDYDSTIDDYYDSTQSYTDENLVPQDSQRDERSTASTQAKPSRPVLSINPPATFDENYRPVQRTATSPSRNPHLQQQPTKRRVTSLPDQSPTRSPSSPTAATAVMAQEMSAVQALKRLSIGALPTLDPDLPNYNEESGFTTSPRNSIISPTSDRLSFEFPSPGSESSTSGSYSQRQQPEIDASQASQLLWVPAHVHPEIAPQQFKNFVQDKLAEIRSSTSSASNSRSNSTSSRIIRRNSSLSRQIKDQEGYTDGADVLEKRRSVDALSQPTDPTIRSLSHQLESLGELEGWSVDPYELVRSLSMSQSSSELTPPQSPVPNDSDSPILPSPTSSLRRSTRTRYNKPSLRRGRRNAKPGSTSTEQGEPSPTNTSFNISETPESTYEAQASLEKLGLHSKPVPPIPEPTEPDVNKELPHSPPTGSEQYLGSRQNTKELPESPPEAHGLPVTARETNSHSKELPSISLETEKHVASVPEETQHRYNIFSPAISPTSQTPKQENEKDKASPKRKPIVNVDYENVPKLGEPPVSRQQSQPQSQHQHQHQTKYQHQYQHQNQSQSPSVSSGPSTSLPTSAATSPQTISNKTDRNVKTHVATTSEVNSIKSPKSEGAPLWAETSDEVSRPKIYKSRTNLDGVPAPNDPIQKQLGLDGRESYPSTESTDKQILSEHKPSPEAQNSNGQLGYHDKQFAPDHREQIEGRTSSDNRRDRQVSGESREDDFHQKTKNKKGTWGWLFNGNAGQESKPSNIDTPANEVGVDKASVDKFLNRTPTANTLPTTTSTSVKAPEIVVTTSEETIEPVPATSRKVSNSGIAETKDRISNFFSKKKSVSNLKQQRLESKEEHARSRSKSPQPPSNSEPVPTTTKTRNKHRGRYRSRSRSRSRARQKSQERNQRAANEQEQAQHDQISEAEFNGVIPSGMGPITNEAGLVSYSPEAAAFYGAPYQIPAYQYSHKSLYMMNHRYEPHIERAIYRLSHLKLGNPRRPLVQQVLLSNFMYAYLNLINQGFIRQQQEAQLQQQKMQQQQVRQQQQQDKFKGKKHGQQQSHQRSQPQLTNHFQHDGYSNKNHAAQIPTADSSSSSSSSSAGGDDIWTGDNEDEEMFYDSQEHVSTI